MTYDPRHRKSAPTLDERGGETILVQPDLLPDRDLDIGDGISARISGRYVWLWGAGFDHAVPISIAALGRLGQAIIEELS